MVFFSIPISKVCGALITLNTLYDYGEFSLSHSPRGMAFSAMTQVVGANRKWKGKLKLMSFFIADENCDEENHDGSPRTPRHSMRIA